MSLNVILERAKEEDAETLADVSKRAFHSDFEVGAPNREGGPLGYDSAAFQANIMKWLDYYKILLDGKIVGGLMVEKKRPCHYECQRIFVDPDYHNQGIATKAFEIAWKIYPDAKIWTLGTPEWNVRTKHFYEKLGFVQVGWTKEEKEWRGRYYEKIMDDTKPYVRMKVGELEAGMKGVEVDATVQDISKPKEVRSKDGKPLRIAEATISDGAASMKLALWDDQISHIAVNDRIRIYKGFVTSFRGQKQLNVGKYDPLVILL